MRRPTIPERGRLLVIGFLLLFTPAIFLMVTLLILIIGRNILVNELTAARILELYLVKVVLFTVLLLILYKILGNVSETQIPKTLDESKRRERGEKTTEDDTAERAFEGDEARRR